MKGQKMVERKNNSRFGRGGFGHKGGCYSCKMCGKLTRETGEGESGVEMCLLCYEKSSCENSLSDNGWGEHGDLERFTTVAEVHAEFERLRKAAGGVL